MFAGRQRQRHGVTKNIVEGLGGALVGAAVVLLLAARTGGRPAADGNSGGSPAPRPADASPKEEE